MNIETQGNRKVQKVRFGKSQAVIFNQLAVLKRQFHLFTGAQKVDRGITQRQKGAVISAVAGGELNVVPLHLGHPDIDIDLGGIFGVGLDFRIPFQLHQTQLVDPQQAVFEIFETEPVALPDHHLPAHHLVFGVSISGKIDAVKVCHFTFINIKSHIDSFILGVQPFHRVDLGIQVSKIIVKLPHFFDRFFTG